MTVNRRLVAVVVADVVGYSRLMERDEAGTHDRLRTLRAELVDLKITAHGGRIVKTSGDGLLLEFPSATSALRCAVEVQREMGARNANLADDDRIDFRIGINLGDIIVDGDDILGDGVNVAARLEPLAAPGGICVSASVREQVHDDLGVDYVDAGAQRVKNISKPVHMYRIALGGGLDRDQRKVLGLRLQSAWMRQAGMAAGVVAVAAVATVLISRGALRPVPEKADEPPSLYAVMIAPFEVASDDPALAAAAPQLTADVTKALGDGVRWARVTAPGVAAGVAAGSKDPRSMGREAAVRWIIQCDLRPEGEGKVAFSMRMVDTKDGRQVSNANRTVERPADGNYRPMVPPLTSAARSVLSQVVYAIEASANSEKPTGRELLARTSQLDFQSNPDAAFREKTRLLDEAIKVDPKLARAWAERAAHRIEILDDFSAIADWDKVAAEASADSLRAIELDPDDPVIWRIRGGVLARIGSVDSARAALERAMKLDPTQVTPLGFLALLSRVEGEPEESIRRLDIASKAYAASGVQRDLMACAAHVGMGAYAEAIRECERAKAGDDGWFLHAYLAAAHALTGDIVRAGQAKDQLLKSEPRFTIGGYESRRFHPTPKGTAMDRAHLIPGLRKAGVPE
jgi:adenylate cyclase